MYGLDDSYRALLARLVKRLGVSRASYVRKRLRQAITRDARRLGLLDKRKRESEPTPSR